MDTALTSAKQKLDGCVHVREFPGVLCFTGIVLDFSDSSESREEGTLK